MPAALLPPVSTHSISPWAIAGWLGWQATSAILIGGMCYITLNQIAITTSMAWNDRSILRRWYGFKCPIVSNWQQIVTTTVGDVGNKVATSSAPSCSRALLRCVKAAQWNQLPHTAPSLSSTLVLVLPGGMDRVNKQTCKSQQLQQIACLSERSFLRRRVRLSCAYQGGRQRWRHTQGRKHQRQRWTTKFLLCARHYLVRSQCSGASVRRLKRW